MKDLLFLAHRIPYPPNKGDKIRSYHILRYLAERFRVHLGAFVDDSHDWRYADRLQAWCAETCLLPLNPRRSRLRSLSGLIAGEALSLPYYRDAALARWVDGLCSRHDISHVFVFSSPMAQYVLDRRFATARRVIDFVDVDSDKWRQYAQSKPWPLSWVYRREAERLAAFECRAAQVADVSLFVSAREAGLFRELCPDVGRVDHFDNGVDWRYFSPIPESDNPYAEHSRPIVFTGAMDYWANVDAVSWFAREVFPRIRELQPFAEFVIVGSRPGDEVRRLEKQPGVRVTGSVEDVRPYLEHAYLSVAPLRIARGVQNKVLEAMAMAKPVVATRAALDGIHYPVGQDLRLAEEPADMAREILGLLERRTAAPTARDWVRRRYDWNLNLQRLMAVLDPPAGGRPRACLEEDEG
ncbi:TIGR03087 family PEP-CTERM/XrtA system glycosyltransferase [Thiohalobacter sp. IOR34]|uniref:TIGR03087 family PEP-CTERM/XrtA system glycosyltransferase n=1 Tax=Thiohalobacter sp. IOR34 TaxID=3057176 RepID=UPI0025B0C466|nr:TIGR03087 family PEP-CTERM/XrtA system glycosyltransferase [Thiohalobacter sp. IOR34]WJW74459.1 TIGR03087 family PEP-CTERM/XrtA system glycosyltransferase [Thiohalobacter sp. IOR34]